MAPACPFPDAGGEKSLANGAGFCRALIRLVSMGSSRGVPAGNNAIDAQKCQNQRGMSGFTWEWEGSVATESELRG
jgi:hypothetical protein